MAHVAGVRNFQLLGFGRRDEPERVAANHHVSQSLLDRWHVARNALASRTAGFVMRVFLDGLRSRPIWGTGAVTVQTQNICRLPKQGIIRSAVGIVARETRNPVRIHNTRYKVIALHPVFMRSAVGKMCERRLAKFVRLQFPKIAQLQTDLIADRPVIVFSGNGIGQRASL